MILRMLDPFRFAEIPLIIVLFFCTTVKNLSALVGDAAPLIAFLRITYLDNLFECF